jgi:vitamin-K-epoxide reductase (warfarin-sensitive)
MDFTHIEILSFIGLILSVYALNVRVKASASKDKSYKPLCDVSERVSCTKAFSSSYGKTFGMPNPVYGIILYMIIIVLAFLSREDIMRYFIYFMLLASVWLAYVSYIKQKNFCVVCSGIYLINILLFLSLFT